MLMLGAISIHLAKRNPPGSAWEPCGTTLQRAWGGLQVSHTMAHHYCTVLLSYCPLN